MDPEVEEFFLTPESFIAQRKNEDFGNWDTTTLLPLDSNTLEVICRVNLPGCLFTKPDVFYPRNNLGFEQTLHLKNKSGFGDAYVNIVQCPSHTKALQAMKHVITSECEEYWERGRSYEGLGKYAVEIPYDDDIVHAIKLIWVRWTTVVEIFSEACKLGIHP